MSLPSLLRVPSDTGRVGRAIGYISLILALLSALVLAGMMVLTFFDVIGRYFFNAPIIGSVEIISLMMGLVVFLGLGLATFEDGHIRVDIVTQLLPRKARLLMDVFAHFLSLGIAGLMSWRLTMVALDQTAEMNETQVLALPIWAVALVMAACSTLLVIGLGWHLSRAVRAFKG